MNIKTLILQTREYYKSLEPVYCPILDQTIYFSSDGFNHLIYDTNRKPRNINEQYLKLKCLSQVKKVIEKCVHITETRTMVSQDDHELTFYSLELGEIRVIIKRKGTGKYKFQSIMPTISRRKNKKRLTRRS